jgi:septal ring factor EnvC (AmiA/AmiB activator)
MKPVRTALFLFCCFSFFATDAGDAPPPALRDLEALTAQWIELRGTLAEEKRNWVKRKAAWESELDLLEEQQRVLAAEIARSRDSISDVEENKAEVVARREQAEQDLQEVDAVLEDAIRNTLTVVLSVPESLKASWSTEVRSFSETGSPQAPRAQRAQRLVALLSGIESVQNRFHTVQERIATPQGTRLADVIYVGLGRGFAVSPTNDWSAVGTPGPQGWTWTPGEADPEQVRLLIQVHQQQETAALATVPFAVEETP